MRDIENTAVNDLIARFGEPRPGQRAEPRVAARPAPFEDTALPVYPVALPEWREPVSPRALHALAEGAPVEHLVPTFQMRRKPPSYLRTTLGRLVLPMAILVGAGVVIGTYVFGRGSAAVAVAPAPAAVAAPVVSAPAPAPAAAPVAPAPVATAPAAEPAAAARPIIAPVVGAPALVDIRIESNPPGATVVLIDRGKEQLVGDTPIDAAVDPTRAYDLVFSHPGGAARTEHLDPATTRRVSVDLAHREPARREPPHRAHREPSHRARRR